MSYQLPEPALPNCVIGKDSTMRQIRLDCYTADQMQAAYQAGREAMKAECVKVCEEQYEYYGYDHIFAKKIKELK